MEKVHILSKCLHCGGAAYLPSGEGEDYRGEKFVQHKPCPICQGSGLSPRWIEIEALALLIEQSKCPHLHTVHLGSFHLTNGELWDDCIETCSDCGALLK